MSALCVLTAEPVVSLATIDMEKLLLQDPDTKKDLFHAAETPGFFYVDLRGPSYTDMLADINALFSLFHDYFVQPQDTKAADFRNGIERGYKLGKGHESFEIAQAELQNKELAFPGMLEAHKAVLTRFAERSNLITQILLRSLLHSLGKEITQSPDPGDSGLKFISAPTCAYRQDAPDTTHTDGGILTLLWCPQLSSQILEPRTNTWGWVEPKEGHALVNVADTLQRQSGGRLHSCVHRVTQPADGVERRHFLSYYLRSGTI